MTTDAFAVTSLDDLIAIGEKIVEMVDRVKIGNKHTPGAVARWKLEVDGVMFDVAIRVQQ